MLKKIIMSKRAIVLGGAGLIGSHLCVRLLMEGYDVICIDKRGRRESPLLRNIENRERFHYIKHDLATPYAIGCDEIYNLISPVEYGDDCNYLEDQRITPLSINNSLHNIIGSNTKVLYGSSDDVYNFDRLDVAYDSPKEFIAQTKRFGESMHRAYSLHHKIDVRIARIFSTYGAGAGLRDQHVIGKMIVEALNNNEITIYGNGDHIRTFCWVEDMVDGLIRLMRAHNLSRLMSVDLGASTQISIRELAEMIISLTGSRSPIRHIAARESEPRHKIPNLKAAKSQLEWEPTTNLHEGLMRTICYIEKELSAITMSQMSWVEIYG